MNVFRNEAILLCDQHFEHQFNWVWTTFEPSAARNDKLSLITLMSLNLFNKPETINTKSTTSGKQFKCAHTELSGKLEAKTLASS